MINETSGDLLKADVDAIVNTVNCVGVMGKGIALQVKRRYPDVFATYARECKAKNVRVGQMLVVPTNELRGPAWVINFPTKTHWKSPSQLSYIRDGLPDLLRVVKELGIRSIAVPPLGAGNGGLDWSQVRPLIVDAFSGLPDIDVQLFEPTNAFQHIRQSSRVRMTHARALLLLLMHRYADAHAEVEPHSGKGLSHLEIQKLLYFADVAEPSLKFSFSPGRYGPYSDRARHLLISIEGSYISGFGDGNDKVLDLRPIQTTDQGDAELANYLDAQSEPVTAVADRVMELVAGYEEPYGLELLASTHWVTCNEDAKTPESAADAVRSWTQRKGRIFTDRHVGRAFAHLRAVGALPG